ncbi:hypothetical protein GF343_00210, partial [Candidatus Woesearchaeota archaeon]|nr:hypothetical protein [Candidatus Woesearchaeota archaeon]
MEAEEMKVALLCKRRGKLMASAMSKQKIGVKLIDDKHWFSRCAKSFFTKADVYHTDNSYIEALVTGINARLRRKSSSITIRGKDFLLHINERHNFLVSFILERIEFLSFLLTDKIFFVCKDTLK